MNVKRIINKIFTSNTYILSQPESDDVWLVDAGDTEKVIQWLSENHKKLRGIFITHAHFDHIYGLNTLYEYDPTIPVYISEKGKEGLYSDKYNLSHFTEQPFVYKGKVIQLLQEGDRITLWNDIFLEVIATPGHDWSCLSFIIQDNLFSGDSYIPGIPVVKNLPNSNKKLALESEKRIIDYNGIHVIYPGHEDCLKK